MTSGIRITQEQRPRKTKIGTPSGDLSAIAEFLVFVYESTQMQKIEFAGHIIRGSSAW